MSTQKSIYAKLIAARAEFHSTSITKTGFNSFSKYNYFELCDFVVKAMDIMAKNDLIPVTSFATELATMTVHDITSDATIVITSPMSSADLKACQPVQSMGAVETFQRRYLWMVLLEIVEHDVIESSSAGNVNDTRPVEATAEQLASIQEYKEADQIHATTQKWIDKQQPLTEKKAAGLLRRLKKENE